MKIIDFINGILLFQYGYKDVAFFDSSVVFKTPKGVKYGYIQEVAPSDEDFVYNKDTFANADIIFQWSSDYIRMFKKSDLWSLLGKYRESITKREDGFMVCPYMVVRNIIVSFPITELKKVAR